MRTLILNSADIVPNTGNATLSYEFTGGNVSLKKGQKIALASLQMYNSTFNITAANQNNILTYYWINSGSTSFNVVFPDGNYTIAEINDYFHLQMSLSTRLHYMVNSIGQNIYFLNININPTFYKVEITTTALSVGIAATNSWTQPVGASWTIPTTINPIAPTLRIPFSQTLAKMYIVLGFDINLPVYAIGQIPANNISGTYPTITQSPAVVGSSVAYSTLPPQVSVVSSYIMTCSLINNNYAVPNNLIYSFAPQGTVGEQFTVAPNQYVFIDVLEGQYSRFTVSFIDQNFKPVIFQDPNMIIQLVISDPPNIPLKRYNQTIQ